MSLFGDFPDDPPAAKPTSTSKSLFGEEAAPSAPSASSLFADDAADASPWSMPTPKKAARQTLVRSLLPGTDVPDSYIDAFDTVLDSDRVGSGIGLTGVKNILQSSGLSPADQARILNLIIPGGLETANGLSRAEFNVLLALVGLGQEGEEITLDGVDERRKRLPQPNLPYIDELKQRSPARPSTPPPVPQPAAASVTRPKKQRQDSLEGNPAIDPWASPAVPTAPAPSTAAHTIRANGFAQDSTDSSTMGKPSSGPYTTHSGAADSTPPTESAPSGDATGWSGYAGGGAGNFSDTGLGGGFGDTGEQPPDRPNQIAHRPKKANAGTSHGTGEYVTITMLPDKEGMFMFQHRNYEVKSIRRNTSVVRRFSDFVWLLDCLHKRYPFRRLPLLPPKRLQVNGAHLTADAVTFLEKRRRGLVRFVNALVQHPVLNQEQLVVMFLTVPTYQELAVWRKQATISVQEEFAGKNLPPNLEDNLPATLLDLFDQVRVGVKRSCDIYINLCTLLERLAKRNEGLAADNLRFSLALQSLVEASADTYAIDTNDVPLLNDGFNSTAKYMSTCQALLEDEAKAWDTGVLEDLKRQRDALVAMRDVFDRRDRLAKDNIPQLERRIEASENKLQQLRQKGPGGVKAGEIEKVESSIISDKESIVQQHNRGVFIKECIRDEIVTFQSSMFAVSRLHQDWAQERVKYAELQASNWRGLSENIESMPTGES